MAEAIRKNKDINGINIPTSNKNVKFQAKISSFADDMQLFLKDLKPMNTGRDLPLGDKWVIPQNWGKKSKVPPHS